MTNNIIQFRPKGYIKPQDRQAVIEACQEGITAQIQRVGDAMEDISLKMMVDITFNRTEV